MVSSRIDAADEPKAANYVKNLQAQWS